MTEQPNVVLIHGAVSGVNHRLEVAQGRAQPMREFDVT
jgi:hypothetical protein